MTALIPLHFPDQNKGVRHVVQLRGEARGLELDSLVLYHHLCERPSLLPWALRALNLLGLTGQPQTQQEL